MARRGSSNSNSKGRGSAERLSGPAGERSSGGVSDKAVGWTTLVSGIVICAFLWWRNHYDAQMYFNEYNLLNTALILGLPLMIILLFWGREPAEFGFVPGDRRQGVTIALCCFLLFIPVILTIAPMADAQAYYIGWMGQSRAVIGATWLGNHYSTGRLDWARLAYHEGMMGFYMLGWEFFFRGYLLNGMRKIAPVWAAVLVQAILFTAMHWSKPPAEVISSFPGAILMAILAIRTRSFLPCFLLHWMISAGFDGAVLYYHFHPHT